MSFDVAAATDRGRIRPNNEDAILSRPDLGLFAIADGMGGHAAGEIASAMAIQAVERAVETAIRDATAPRRTLVAAIEAANLAVCQRAAREVAKRGMGTTLTCLWARPPGTAGWIAHVGDSRVYRLRDRRLRQITLDHTWVQEQIDAGELTRAQARVHPLSSVITRAVGSDASIAVDLHRTTLAAGDLFLLCSDGLTATLEDAEIAGILGEPAAPHLTVARLVQAANARGGPDNISAIVLRVAEQRTTAGPRRRHRSAPRSRPGPAPQPPADRRA